MGEPVGSRMLRGPGCLPQLGDYLRDAGHLRALVLCGPSRRHLPALQQACAEVVLEVFDGARAHVPRQVVELASARLSEAESDVLIALGGGAATGLGKMLRRQHAVGFVAVPTTFSGSEMTEVWGSTDAGDKRTGRDPRVRPDLVVHDAALFDGMPTALAVASGLNALAHPVSALSTGKLEGPVREMALDAVARLYPAIGQLAAGGAPLGALDGMLVGTALAGRVIDAGGLGLHHRIAHLLGGRTGLPHSGLHSVLLPHSTAALRAQALLWQAVTSAAGDPAPDLGMQRMLEQAGAATSLAQLGLSDEQLGELSDALSALGADVQRHVSDAHTGRPPAS